MKLKIIALFLLFSVFRVYSKEITLPVQGFETECEEPVPITIEWDEKWFGTKSSFEYSHKIARIASILAEVSYVDVAGNPKENELTYIYRLLGVNDDEIEYNYELDYNAPILKNNQAAFSFARTEIDSAIGKKNLIFIVIRGTPLNANEWISNVAISDSSRSDTKIHEGFYQTTNLIHSKLISYLLRHGINPEESFFIITGHSRGAATANLLGSMIADDGYFDTKKVFDYTFATPNVSAEDRVTSDKYKFIWNIINAEDMVPVVPPNRNNWKFRKFGTTLTLVNSWNTDPEVFDNEYLPKMNEYYNKLMLRDYAPFRTGSFLPAQVARIMTTVYKEIAKYYGSVIGLRTKAEAIFNKIFPEEEEETEEGQEEAKAPKKGNGAIMEKLYDGLNSYTKGGVDYALNAFVDMHACESYMSWLLALEEDQVFSEMGSTQVVINGNYDCAVFDEEGNVVARVVDGILQLKSLKRPVSGIPLPDKTILGFPGNADFNVVFSKESLIPTYISADIEHYDAQGLLTGITKKQHFWPHKGKIYYFPTGSIGLNESTLELHKVSGKRAKLARNAANLKTTSKFKFSPEINFNTDNNMGIGLHFGNKNIYVSALTSQTLTKFGTTVDIAPGIGHQEIFYSRIMADVEAYGKFIWDTSNWDFSFVPSARLSLSIQPIHRMQFFVAGVFDFHIDKFNDSAFKTTNRENNLGTLDPPAPVEVIPSLRFGVRF